MNRFRNLILVSCLFGSLIGCALDQAIQYKTDDIAPSHVDQIKGITLSVETFADKRKDVEENGIVFVEGRETKISDKRVCINAEEHYNKEPAARQITVAIWAHLKQRGAFNDVLVDSKSAADYQLQGAIRQFYGQQDFSYSSAIGAQFGLIGALLTRNSTTPGIIKIELTDLKILDKNGNQVKLLKNISKSFQGNFPVDGHCWQVYWNTNLKLKEVVDILADDIENNLRDSIIKKPDEINVLGHNN